MDGSDGLRDRYRSDGLDGSRGVAVGLMCHCYGFVGGLCGEEVWGLGVWGVGGWMVSLFFLISLF